MIATSHFFGVIGDIVGTVIGVITSEYIYPSRKYSMNTLEYNYGRILWTIGMCIGATLGTPVDYAVGNL